MRTNGGSQPPSVGHTSRDHYELIDEPSINFEPPNPYGLVTKGKPAPPVPKGRELRADEVVPTLENPYGLRLPKGREA
jgi:hypothetical protein